MVRRQARVTVDEVDRGSESDGEQYASAVSDDDAYASAVEEAAEVSEGEGEEVIWDGESELLAWSAGTRCRAGWPRADALVSGDG